MTVGMLCDLIAAINDIPHTDSKATINKLTAKFE